MSIVFRTILTSRGTDEQSTFYLRVDDKEQNGFLFFAKLTQEEIVSPNGWLFKNYKVAIKFGLRILIFQLNIRATDYGPHTSITGGNLPLFWT